MKSIHEIILPHDEISFHFIKFLSQTLENMGFTKSFEHMDPGGVDTYRYETKDGQTVVITRTFSSGEKVEIKIQAGSKIIGELINKAADNFGRTIADSIKKGGTMRL
jgi:hypothetical protein